MGDNNYWNNDDDDQQGNQSGKGLREQLQKALDKLKEAEARATTAEGKLAERSASEVLKSKGYPEKIARIASNDGVDIADNKALEKWLEDNKDILPVPQTAQAENEDGQNKEGEQQQQVVDKVDESAVSAHNRLAGLHSQASPDTLNKFQLAEKSLKDDATPEDVLKAFRVSGL